MWREVVHRVHDEEYPDVELEDLLVDNTAMQLINRPADFDVVVTENMFGDILSDEAAQITGSLGMLASASLGDGVSLFEPSAGSAPDIAGQGIANPLAQILSVGMMLTYAFGMVEEAGWIEAAVERVLNEGWRTRDIADESTPRRPRPRHLCHGRQGRGRPVAPQIGDVFVFAQKRDRLDVSRRPACPSRRAGAPLCVRILSN